MKPRIRPLLSASAVLALCASLCALACGGNHPPRLSALVNREVAVGSTLEILVIAVDDDRDALRFGVSDKPERATFESTALGGRFLWTPLASDVPPGDSSRTFSVTFFVDDAKGGRDAETVLVTVTRGAPGEGAPRFTTPADFVLDLGMTDTLDVTLSVQDDDSPSVALTLEDAPVGARLETLGPKTAQLLWTPTLEQIAERALYFLRVAADDGANEVVVQEVSVLLRRKSTVLCTGEPPSVAHEPLVDQSGPGPYRVEADIFDADGEIRQATLFWSRVPTPTSADFSSVPLTRDSVGADLFAGNIPDLGLGAGQSATVTYFVCATDDDDAAGDACDHVSCIPAEHQRFAFVAAVGVNSCTDDSFEPNDAFGAAKMITSGVPLRALRACGGNEDWFKLQLAAGDVLDAGITFTEQSGALSLEAYAPNGSTRLAIAPTSVNERKLQLTAATAGVYFVRVTAPMGTSSTYDLTATSRAGSSCVDDRHEPNDSAGEARTLAVGAQATLRVCAGNDDWYKISLRAGDALDASITFVSSMGDLDLEVYRPDRTTLLGKSDGVTDTEALSFKVVPETGFYYVRVYGYQRAQNGYALTLGGARCTGDSLEPNETQGAARMIAPGTQRSLALCPSDDDWFKLPLTAGQRLRVTARFKNADGDLDLRTYKPDGSNLASSFSLDDDESVDVAAPVTGTYFIRVFSLENAQNAYDLEVVVAAQ